MLANDTDVDGGPISITSVTQPANGTVVITNGGAGLTYAPGRRLLQQPSGDDRRTPSPTPWRRAAPPRPSRSTVTCVDDAPVAVDDTKTVAEDDPATTIDVLANDTDADGGADLDHLGDPARQRHGGDHQRAAPT